VYIIKNKFGLRNAIKALEVLFESLNFIALQYILLCFFFSFRTSIVYVLVFAVNVSTISKYWSFLKGAITNKVLFTVIFSINIIIIGFAIYKWGYFPVITVLKEII
jgi:hypothetical protein